MAKWLLLLALPGGSVLVAAAVVRWWYRRHQAAIAERDAARIKGFTYRASSTGSSQTLKTSCPTSRRARPVFR
jgi:hypothetical protein